MNNCKRLNKYYLTIPTEFYQGRNKRNIEFYLKRIILAWNLFLKDNKNNIYISFNFLKTLNKSCIFLDHIVQKANIATTSTGNDIASFREIHSLSPRGRYDIKFFQTFIHLHGKTFDYKIPVSTVIRYRVHFIVFYLTTRYQFPQLSGEGFIL